MVQKFDIAVIGSGAAGFSAAETAHRNGASVCLIEKDAWGGECPNYACIPTKAMLYSAKKYYETKYHLQEFGIYANQVTFNFQDIAQRREDIIELITNHGKKLRKVAKDMGIDVFSGSAKFTGEHELAIGRKKIKAKSIIIATGSTDFIPPIEGIHETGWLGYRDITSMNKLPSSLVIIGGGPVGVEFATFFGMLGTKVTLIQMRSRILHREDEELSLLAQRQLENIGVVVLTNAVALSTKKQGKKKEVIVQIGKEERKAIFADNIVLAAGKRQNIQGLHLEKAGVNLDEKGRLKVNDYLQTNKKHIFVAGDVSGGMMFTHTAHYEGGIAGYNACKKSTSSYLKRNLAIVPRVTFCSPEVASVGITISDAKKKKLAFDIAQYPLRAMSRAITEGKTVGFLKIIYQKKTKQILGAHILGERAGEIIHEIAFAMHAKKTIEDLNNMIHAFPTYSELIPATASQL